ncbi:hypothetical protein OKW42_008556 [Paraburkholderia sp. WC7.3d]
MLSRGRSNVGFAQAMDISPDVVSISLYSNVSESVRLGQVQCASCQRKTGCVPPGGIAQIPCGLKSYVGPKLDGVLI